MAPFFIFAEQVRSIVRSGKTEIEIPAGARISPAAADLIKDHHIRIKTVAPGPSSSGEAAKTEVKSAKTAQKGASVKQMPPSPPAEKTKPDLPPRLSAEISEEELEDIVNRVIARFRQLKDSTTQTSMTAQSAQAVANPDAESEHDDLIICRCEEITRGEIKTAIRNGILTLNGIKRVTRAGMGLCQGQTCQQLVARILVEELGLSAAGIDPTTARGPVRPLSLAVFANS